MAPQYLVASERGRTTAKTAKVADDPARLLALTSSLAWRIVQELARKPDFAGNLARRLGVHDQKVYYHVRRLEDAGVLEEVRQVRRRGAVSRILAPTAEAFAVELPGAGSPFTAPPELATSVRRFFAEFIDRGRLQGTIVVGSPYPHGPFLTVARDSPFATRLGLLLGSLATPSAAIRIRLDTEVKARGAYEDNFVLVGGPVANIVTLDLNASLPVSFDWRESWRMQSRRTGRTYTEETVGLVSKLPSPWAEGRTVVVLSGIHNTGTMAAILALTDFADVVLADYRGDVEFSAVVEGVDRDGDGVIDEVHVRE